MIEVLLNHSSISFYLSPMNQGSFKKRPFFFFYILIMEQQPDILHVHLLIICIVAEIKAAPLD